MLNALEWNVVLTNSIFAILDLVFMCHPSLVSKKSFRLVLNQVFLQTM